MEVIGGGLWWQGEKLGFVYVLIVGASSSSFGECGGLEL